MILVLLPLLTLLTIFVVRVGRPDDRPDRDLRQEFVAALILWGVILVFGSEVLSALGALGQAGLAGLWAAATLTALAAGGGPAAVRRGFSRIRAGLRGFTVVESVFLAGTAALLAALFLIAVISPPNNVDSLNVHMVRVVHWAQNQSLAQYSAGGISQLTRPPLAEVAMLNLRQLYGDDRPAALAQWFSFAGILVVASLIAARLGAGRRGQLVAVAFAASLPMAVLEASNTKNDLVVSLWIVCLGYLALESARRALSWDQILQAGAVVGLGLLTKGTFLPAAFPLVLWLGVNLIRRSRPRTWLVALGIIVAAVIGINLRYWAGNISSHGTPFGSLESMARALEFDDLLLRLSGQGPGAEPGPEPPAPAASPLGLVVDLGSWFISRAASLMALHTIYPEVGSPLRQTLRAVPGLFEPGFLASLEEGLWNHEDSAGNLLHLGVVVAASGALALRAFRRRAGVLGIYALTAWAGWAALTLITPSLDLWAIRYQMGFFMLCAPLVGAIAEGLRPSRAMALAFVLLLSAVPYAVLNNTRPLISAPPRTRTASILVATQADLLFASTPEVQHQYQIATSMLAKSSCRQVGLRLRARELEYALWWLLDAPQSGFRMQVLARPEPAPAEGLPTAAPCAVLCTVCGREDQFLGLPLAYDSGFLRLYLSPEP